MSETLPTFSRVPHGDIVIRAVSDADQPAWIRLRHELWPTCTAERHELEVRQLLGSPGAIAVADHLGRIVGFIEASIRRDHVEGTHASPVAYVEGWYVSPAFRAQGIGRALLAHIEHWAAASGFDELASDCETDNTRSIRLHARLGFAEVSTTVHFVKRLSPRL